MIHVDRQKYSHINIHIRLNPFIVEVVIDISSKEASQTADVWKMYSCCYRHHYSNMNLPMLYLKRCLSS